MSHRTAHERRFPIAAAMQKHLTAYRKQREAAQRPALEAELERLRARNALLEQPTERDGLVMGLVAAKMLPVIEGAQQAAAQAGAEAQAQQAQEPPAWLAGHDAEVVRATVAEMRASQPRMRHRIVRDRTGHIDHVVVEPLE